MTDTWSITSVDADTVSVVITIGESQYPWKIGTDLIEGEQQTVDAIALIAEQVAAHAETLRTVITPPVVLANSVGYTANI